MLGVFPRDQGRPGEQERLRKLAESEQKLQDLQRRGEGVNGDLSVLKNSRAHRKWFGLGGLKDEAIREIAAKRAN